LDELYEEGFIRILTSGQRSQSCAIQVFSLLLCTQEALSPEAVIQTLSRACLHQEESMTLTKMINICSDLVVHDFEPNVVRFAHISFQEFLEARPEFAPHHVHRVAAESCLQSCIEGLPTGMESDLSPKNNVYHYSTVYWAEHCGIASVHGAENSIVRKLQEFVFDGDDVGLGFIDWVQEVNKFREKFPRDHVLAKNRIRWLVLVAVHYLLHVHLDLRLSSLIWHIQQTMTGTKRTTMGKLGYIWPLQLAIEPLYMICFNVK